MNRLPEMAVTVYVDDIILSTNLDDSYANAIFEEMCEIASISGLEFGPDKLEPPTDRITAFNIALSHNHMEIRKARLEELAYDAISTDNVQVFDGILGYVASVSSRQAAVLAESIASR